MIEKERIRLLIVDDHPVVRAGLSTFLQRHADIEIVGDCETGEEALALTKRHPVDIVLLDLRMPGMSGLQTLRRLQAQREATKVVILSAFARDEEIHQTIRQGARGYLVKDATEDEMLGALRRVHAGGTYFSKAVLAQLQKRRLRPELTPREVEILKLVTQGLTNKDVAETLHLSRFTVRNHLNSIMSKLDVRDRTEAAFVALQVGFSSVDP